MEKVEVKEMETLEEKMPAAEILLMSEPGLIHIYTA
jgi:hypothetical protein